jgi:hypothetical protein
MSESAQRVDYGNKTGEVGKDKELSSKSLDMLKAGGSGDGGGVTGSPSRYPKSSKVNLTPDFNPMKDSKRGGTCWAVGGV